MFRFFTGSVWRIYSISYVPHLVVLVWMTCLVVGCASVPRNDVSEIIEPSNYRNWKANMAVLSYAKFRGDRVTVYNIRNCTYLDEDSYVVNYYDRTFDLNDLETLEFIVVPFTEVPSLAHTMIAFGFRDGQHLDVSAEVRLEEGETYSPIGGAMHQFELMYVVADERDTVKLRTDVRKSDVYIYPTVASAEQTREVFLDVMRRVNSLKKHPEFYDTLMNNCTTNIVAHINKLKPGRIPWNPATILTGYSDQMAYQFGLLVDYGSFEQTKHRAHVNKLARRYADSPLFSQEIRGRQSAAVVARQTGRLVR